MSSTQVNLSNSAGNGGLLRISTFTASGTWTKQSDVGSIVVEVTGGGGAGGAITAGLQPAGSGGGGGYSQKRIISTSLGATEVVTVGASGGASSFGSHCSAAAGSVGASSAGALAAGGLGGSGSGGDLNLTGTSGNYNGLAGGDSPRISGGGTNINNTVAGMQAGRPNSGGGGTGRTLSVGAGSLGGTGLVIVYEYSK